VRLPSLLHMLAAVGLRSSPVRRDADRMHLIYGLWFENPLPIFNFVQHFNISRNTPLGSHAMTTGPAAASNGGSSSSSSSTARHTASSRASLLKIAAATCDSSNGGTEAAKRARAGRQLLPPHLASRPYLSELVSKEGLSYADARLKIAR
jgi:hypothetical protein